MSLALVLQMLLVGQPQMPRRKDFELHGWRETSKASRNGQMYVPLIVWPSFQIKHG